MMKSDLVSIIMPAYNAEQYIREAIESVLVQSYPHWELIVVNDGSTDETKEIVAQFPDKRIKLIDQENNGEASARNKALAHSHGEFIAFLDADDIYIPDHLKTTITYLQCHPELDGVFTDGHYCDQSGNLLQTLSSQRRGPYEGWIFEQLVRSSDVFGPPLCVVLRINPIVQYGLDLDTRIWYGTDWDFFTRYAEFTNFGYLDQCTCLYRVHKTNMTITTNQHDKLLSWAICREKAIKLFNFSKCSLDTRRYVFYDLLVNLLTGEPEHQEKITQWPEFNALPVDDQARLLRLIASEAIYNGAYHQYLIKWLYKSRSLNPADWRGAILYSLYQFSPQICKFIVQMRRLANPRRLKTSLFA